MNEKTHDHKNVRLNKNVLQKSVPGKTFDFISQGGYMNRFFWGVSRYKITAYYNDIFVIINQDFAWEHFTFCYKMFHTFFS